MKGDASRQKKAQPVWGCALSGGATRNRTGDEGFADLCLTAWLWRRMGESDRGVRGSEPGFGPEMRTNCAERKTEPTRALNPCVE